MNSKIAYNLVMANDIVVLLWLGNKALERNAKVRRSEDQPSG